ncbi:unnamed protein product [Phaedon cochleariae]|uniref:Uncharacterized protein n=1 Tax=Phaedon cochleariae TaxID=80249 RepID=A0A9P0DIQ6_PHACE|nr:unnamed protein product [Phaedon cochleariae]
MKVLHFVSIMMTVVELLSSEAENIEWVKVNCSQYETQDYIPTGETETILSIQKNESRAHYEGNSTISCIEVEENARQCDVQIVAGGIGNTFVDLSLQRNSNQCQDTLFQVRYTTIPARTKSSASYEITELTTTGFQRQKRNEEHNLTTIVEYASEVLQNDKLSTIKKYVLIYMILAQQLDSVLYFVIISFILLSTVIIIFYFYLKHIEKKIRTKMYTIEEEYRIKSSDDEFPDYENV